MACIAVLREALILMMMTMMVVVVIVDDDYGDVDYNYDGDDYGGGCDDDHYH